MRRRNSSSTIIRASGAMMLLLLGEARTWHEQKKTNALNKITKQSLFVKGERSLCTFSTFPFFITPRVERLVVDENSDWTTNLSEEKTVSLLFLSRHFFICFHFPAVFASFVRISSRFFICNEARDSSVGKLLCRDIYETFNILSADSSSAPFAVGRFEPARERPRYRLSGGQIDYSDAPRKTRWILKEIHPVQQPTFHVTLFSSCYSSRLSLEGILTDSSTQPQILQRVFPKLLHRDETLWNCSGKEFLVGLLRSHQIHPALTRRKNWSSLAIYCFLQHFSFTIICHAIILILSPRFSSGRTVSHTRFCRHGSCIRNCTREAIFQR